MKTVDDFTVNILKEKLKDLGLSTAGVKAELFLRMMEADPTGTWMNDTTGESREEVTGESPSVSDAPTMSVRETSQQLREMALMKREKELMERELELARREIEFLRGSQHSTVESAGRTTRNAEISGSSTSGQRTQSRTNIQLIADLVNRFDGSCETYEVWEKQIRLLMATYQLNENEARLLISLGLKGKASEWFRSKVEFLQIPIEELLGKMKEMYDHRPSKLILKKRFEERIWKKDETFSEYVHGKVILANLVPITEDEIIDYIVDGIPDTLLKDQARLHRFRAIKDILEAFEHVSLKERMQSRYGGDRRFGRSFEQRQREAEESKERSQATKRCYNCGKEGHITANCPTKIEKVRCYKCGERGHFASKCPKKHRSDSAGVANSSAVSRNALEKNCKDVKIGDYNVTALIDTGSDICLMRADKYVRIGAPPLQGKEVCFRGVGSSDNKTLGEFHTDVTIDGNLYRMKIHVISDALMQHELLIGTDFLNTVEVLIKEGKILINKPKEESATDDTRPDIFKIECIREVNQVDVSHIADKYKRDIERMTESYVPKKEHCANVKMTIVLRDDEPVYQRARRLAPSEREEVNAQEASVIARLRKAQHSDDTLSNIFSALENKQIKGYVIKNGLLYKECDNDILLIVPRSMQAQVIRQAHENGHFSTTKTEALLRKDYWFQDMKAKIEKVLRNCIPCILAEKQRGRQEGLLCPIDKGEIPLDVYHIDHLGPLPSTRKQYRFIFVVVDAFAKFVWLYATRTTNTAEVLDRLKKQSAIFGNPRKIISDRGTAFTSGDFEDYCKFEGIQHSLITTGVPRANGQVERVNRTIIPLLTKLSAPKPDEWFKHLETAQKFLNSTLHRSIGRTPFEILFGTHMRMKENLEVREIINRECVEMYDDNRNDMRRQAKEHILKIQEENRRVYNRKRKKARRYQEDDLVAIRRTQLGPGQKLHSKYLGPYRIARVLRNDRYIVHKVGDHEGPQQTSTAAEFMKSWIDDESDSGSDNEISEDI